MSDITIKNIPLHYLKGQSSEFFKSEEYKRMIDLFDKVKEKSPLLPGKSSESGLLPLETMKDIIVAKYFERELKHIQHEDKINYLICMLASMYKQEDFSTKNRKYVNRCASSLNKNTFVLCKTVPTVPSIIKKSHSELKEDNKESLQRIKSLIIPDRTNDPVFDVANRSNFYDNHVHSNIYDDNKYAEAVLKSIMSSTQKLNNRVKSIENYDNKKSYIYSDEGNIQHLKVLQKLIVDRYVGSTRGNILSEKNEGMNRITYSENYIELIKKIHTNKKIDCRLGIFLYTSFQKLKTWKVKHDLDNTYYRIFCFDTDGSLVKPESFTKDDQNNLTLEFSKPVSGKVLLMYDEYDQTLVEKKNIKEYFDLIHNKKLNVLIGVRYDDGYIFRINGLERDFFVYDLFDGNNQLTEKVSKIDVSVDGFYLEFEGKQTFSSEIECYLLPSYEFYGGSNTFRIFPIDIKDITSNFNIFQDQLTIWG